MDMYGLMQACRASGIDAPTTEWMSEEEYMACWKASNVLHYLRNNINAVSGIAGVATAPLLRRIIADIDNCVAPEEIPGSVRMHGYFGHAETLLPLFSLMRLPGCYIISDDYDTLQDHWRIERITPLAANLAIIILRSESGKLYASLRLNGRNISPLPGKGEVVEWSELKEAWQKSLAAAEEN